MRSADSTTPPRAHRTVQPLETADSSSIDRSEGPVRPLGGWQESPVTTGSPPAPVVLLEASLGQPIPEYARRRESSGELLRNGDGTVVFTDSGHTSFVWTFRSTFGGLPARYTEFRLPGGAVGLRRFLRELSTRFEWPLRDVEPGSSCTRETLQGIFRRVPPNMALPGLDLESVQNWMEDLDDLAAVRTLWRAALGTRVCDPSMDRDDWLLGAASVLEAVLLAILDRMRSWVADAEALEPARRSEYLADLRKAIAVADESTHETARSFVRHRIVQRSLFGAIASRADARRSRRRLLRYATLRPSAGAYFDTHITAGLPQPPRPRPASNGPDLSLGVTAAEEERELLRIARVELQETRLRGEGNDREWFAAARQIARREQFCCRFADVPTREAFRGSEVAIPPDGDVVHRWIHEASPFDVVRLRP